MKLIILFFIFSSSVFADVHVLNWGINVEPIIYFKKASVEFKKRVEARSEGRIIVNLFENVVPQEGHDHLGDVMNGTYHMAQETVFALQSRIPGFSIWNLPYLFRDDAHVIKYTKSPIGLAHMARLEDFGVIGLDYTYSGGFLQVFGNKLKSFDDLKLSVFALEEASEDYKKLLSSKFKTTLKEFEPKDKTIKFSEIIGSTGREIFFLAKNKEINWNKTDHRVISRVLFISKSFIQSLPTDLQQIVLEEGRAVAAVERDLSIADSKEVEKEALKKNIKINTWSNEKKMAEKEKFKSLYDSYSSKFGKDIIKSVENLP